jgi:hypothetical protein
MANKLPHPRPLSTLERGVNRLKIALESPLAILERGFRGEVKNNKGPPP